MRYSAPAMDLLLFGIQGSGKGTMARKLVADFGFYHFDAGAELREEIQTGSELGKLISSFIDHGNLVPNDVMMQVTREHFEHFDSKQPVIFDGTPRYIEQQRDFEIFMKEKGREFKCIDLTLDEELAVQRLIKRGIEQGRKDDKTEEYIRHRIAWSKEKTTPVIEDYRARGMLLTVDGNGTPDEVYPKILDALEKLRFAVR